MNWVKADQRLPKDKEEVLLRYFSLITIAVYDAEKGKFISKNSKEEYEKSANLSWLSLYPAPEYQKKE